MATEKEMAAIVARAAKLPRVERPAVAGNWDHPAGTFADPANADVRKFVADATALGMKPIEIMNLGGTVGTNDLPKGHKNGKKANLLSGRAFQSAEDVRRALRPVKVKAEKVAAPAAA
jgi:hypothetical protein